VRRVVLPDGGRAVIAVGREVDGSPLGRLLDRGGR
jgi:hypothetical protein